MKNMKNTSNVNNNTTNNTTNNTSINENKGDKTMKNNISAPMTNKEFQVKTYDAYIQYVRFMSREITPEECVKTLRPLFMAYDYDLNIVNLGDTVNVYMASFGTTEGEKVKKIKSISTFRKFIKTANTYESLRQTSNKGKTNPHEVKSRKTRTTKADLEKRIEELTALLAEKA